MTRKNTVKRLNAFKQKVCSVFNPQPSPVYLNVHRAVFGGLLLFLLALLLALSGCQSQPAPKTTRLTFWTMQMGSFGHVLNPMLRAFERQHPGITVQWVDVPFTEMEKRVLLGVLGNQPPDVVNLNPTFSALLAQRGALVNMGQALTRQQQQTYLPVAWHAVTLASDKPMRFGIPWYLTTALTYWDVTQLPQGQPLPTGWPQLARMKARHGYVALPTLADHGTLVRWLAKQGADPCQPCGAQWLQVMRQGLQSGAFSPDMITASHRTALEQFQQGKLAMLVAGSSVLGLLAENAPERLPHLRLAPQFGARPDVVDVATMLLAVPANSPNRQLAVELALWMTNSPNQLALAKAAPVLPSVQPALNAVTTLPLTLKDQPVKDPVLKRLLTEARQLGVKQLKQATEGMPVLTNQSAVNDQADALVQGVLLGQTSPQQGLARLCDTLKVTY
jgi:putative chitobiose transport system substrate-binding protein